MNLFSLNWRIKAGELRLIRLSFVNVLLFQKEASEPFKGATTDEEGYFQIKNIKDDSARDGVKLIASKVQNFLKTQGIEPIQTETYDEESLHMRQLLKTKLVDMDLSVRALNCLKAAEVDTLGDLVSFNKNDLMKFRNFGKKSLTELEELVINKGLSFGMDLSKYKLDKD